MNEKKQVELEEVFGKDRAAQILANLDARGKALEALEVEYKDFSGSSADTPAEANKQAVANADKAFSELMIEVLESSAIPAEAALEAVKAQNVVIEALRKDLDSVRAELRLRPRASASAETVVETSHLSPTLQESLKEQYTERDEFWGLEVVKTP